MEKPCGSVDGTGEGTSRNSSKPLGDVGGLGYRVDDSVRLGGSQVVYDLRQESLAILRFGRRFHGNEYGSDCLITNKDSVARALNERTEEESLVVDDEPNFNKRVDGCCWLLHVGTNDSFF